MFWSVREQADAAVIKSFRDQEVEIVTLYGKRLEEKHPFLTLAQFESRYSAPAEEIAPGCLLTVKDQSGADVKGVVLKSEDKNAERVLVNFAEEVHARKDFHMSKSS